MEEPSAVEPIESGSNQNLSTPLAQADLPSNQAQASWQEECQEDNNNTNRSSNRSDDNSFFTKPNAPDQGAHAHLIASGSSSSSTVENRSKTTPVSDREKKDMEQTSDKADSKKKSRNRFFRVQQGRTRSMYPRTRSASVSKEMRELSRKHALLEKNLKIEGLPDPPKFRKRRSSLSSNMGRPHDKDVPYKRKRLGSIDSRPRKDHMPKWELMGGDANDPLNLNGLANSEEGRLLNLKTPESSPLPTPDFRKIVYVKVPPNIEDPLNLEGKHDQRVIDKLLNSTIKKRHRPKKKKHDDPQSTTAVETPSTTLPSAEATEAAGNVTAEESKSQTVKAADENMETKKATDISTPTKPAGVGGRRSRSRSVSMSPERKFRRQISGGKGKAGPNEPTKFPQNPKFTLGNYNRYYGYRNKDQEPDPRLQYFHPSWFKGKDVLDIGCNAGHITLALAEHFHPHKILGMDIDGKLIQAARQNIRHMLSQRRKDSSKYPRVFEMTRGPLEAHPLMGSSDNFPNNVLFLQGNYVPGSEEILQLQKEEYDTILALSITKWIHLNNGDNGLKLFFQKIFRQLRPGGRLILEPQPWSTYRKRAKLSPELFAKYQSIKLKPEGFKHYLLSIGFVKCEVIGVPVTKAKGFRRPLILFTKADNKQTPSTSTGEDIDYRDVCQECGSTDKSQCDHPQFTGMRRGPYASHMYDHINYPYTSSDSPYFSSSRPYTGYSYSFNVPNFEDYSGYVGEGSGRSGRRDENVEDIRDNSVMMNYSSGSGGSWPHNMVTPRTASSSSSTSSSVTGSGSRSDRSYSSSGTSSSASTRSSSASYYSPANGPNGDIANDIYSPNSNGLVGADYNEAYSPNLHGPNGDGVHAPYSPPHNGPVDNIADADFNPHVEGPNGDIAHDVDWHNNDSGEGVNPHDGGDHSVAHGNDDFVETVHGYNSMNGDHGVDVVQHWDNDNNDANMDAPIMVQQADIEGGHDVPEANS